MENLRPAENFLKVFGLGKIGAKFFRPFLKVIPPAQVSLFLLILLFGFIYSSFLGNHLRFYDEKEYLGLGQNLTNHSIYSLDGENPTAYRPPFYPLYISFFLDLGADIAFLRFMNFLFLGLSLILTWKILENRGKSAAGHLSSWMIIGYPVLFYASGTLYPQILASFLLLLFLYLIGEKKMAKNRVFLAGIVYGALILTVPIFLIVLLPVLIWWWFPMRSGRRPSVALILIPVVIIGGTWVFRNYLVFQQFPVISSNSGYNLLLGNSENTFSGSGTRVDLAGIRSQAESLSEIDRNRFFEQKAFEFISNNKVAFLKLYLGKFLHHFHYRNNLATLQENDGWKDLLMLLTYGPLLTVFLVRLLFLKKFKPDSFETLLIFLYLSGGVFYAMFFTRIRFRIPFDFLLVIIDSLFLSRFIPFHWIPRKFRNVSRNLA